MILCDRIGIRIASSVSRRTYKQKIQWNCSEGERERRLMFQKVTSRTPYITIIGYQVIQFANNYSERNFITAGETVKHLQTTTMLPLRIGGDGYLVTLDG